jgi:hemerythrin
MPGKFKPERVATLGRSFYQEQFESLIVQITNIFQLSSIESEKLKNNKIAIIIGKLPYLANCNNPERIALSHLAITYIASHEAGKETFLHNLADNEDLFKRLERISHFDGGDKNILKVGMNLLAIVMLNDHFEDSQADYRNGKYNPLNTHVWNHEKLLEELKIEVKDLINHGIFSIYTTDEVQHAFWEIP